MVTLVVSRHPAPNRRNIRGDNLDILRWVTDPMQFAFMQRAMLEVTLMGITTGIIGTYVVLRGMAFIGDALSHAIFPGVVVAFLIHVSFFFGALVFGGVTAVAIGALARNKRVSEDTAIGVLFAGMFALGIVLISTIRGYTADLASFLFGDVLGVSPEDVAASVGIGILVLGALFLFHKEFVMVAFDSDMAEAVGLPVWLVDLGLLILMALTIVVSLRAVGNILVVAMLVTPAAAARLWTDKLLVMMGLSALFGALGGIAGLLTSYHTDLAAGGTIVLVVTVWFGISLLIAPRHGILNRLLRQPNRDPLSDAASTLGVPQSES
ncbi:MAG: metal ABC transporter permease [Chloroflexi bacterium]|nr:metal ABC transporter permease [Chloroflexota bacterium]